MAMTITYQKFIVAILAVVIFIFAIKLYKTYKNDMLEYTNVYDNVESFESNLTKLKSGKNTGSRFENVSSNSRKRNSAKVKRKLTFDDLVKETEDIDPSKYSITNLKQNFFGYVNSFSKEKFKNTTGTTTEALEKFDYFKEKFFEIFT